MNSLADILSGRRHHKNTTNNVVIATLWRRCSLLPDHQDLFREYMASASIVADQFFYSADHPKQVDPKDYTIAQLQHFYEAVITFLVFVECINRPDLKRTLRGCTVELAMDRERVERLLAQLDAHGAVDRAGVGLVYKHLMDESGIGIPTVVPFVMFAAACLAAAARGVQNE
jgi:hypothetical protein